MSRVAAALSLFVLVIAGGGPVMGQTAREQAETMLNGVTPIEDVLSRGTMENVVVPYETDTPPESGLSHTQFDSEEIQLQAEDTPTANAFNAQKDSALGRPEVVIDENALDLANSSIEQADVVAGGLFSSDGGQCSETFEAPSNFQGMQWCRSIVAQNLRVCEQWRDITVDRSDTWTCQVETGNYLKTCTKNVSWSCTGTTGNACFQSALTVSPNAVSWPGDGNVATVNVPKINGGCSVKSSTFNVSYSDIMNLTSLHLSSFDFYGVAQIRINGAVVYAYANRTGNYYTGYRDCGKNCSVAAVFDQSGHIQDCSTAHRSASPNIDLKNYIDVAGPGPSVETALDIALSTGKMSGSVQVQIIRGNSGENATSVNLTAGGTCCSQFSAQVLGTC